MTNFTKFIILLSCFKGTIVEIAQFFFYTDNTRDKLLNIDKKYRAPKLENCTQLPLIFCTQYIIIFIIREIYLPRDAHLVFYKLVRIKKHIKNERKKL